MSIQDDIFDVQAALEGRPEAEAFERVYKALGDLERDWAKHVGTLARLRHGLDAIQEIVSGDIPGLKKR